MITIDIHTWRCPDCGYAQDFDPNDPSLVNKHFRGDRVPVKYQDVGVGECPSCHGKKRKKIKMQKAIESKDKSKMNIMEESDVPVERAKLVTAEPVMIEIGEEIREETDEEQDSRIELYADSLGLSKPDDKKAVKDQMKAMTKVKRRFPIKREETIGEKTQRIDDIINSLKPLNPSEIQVLRDKYEDK